MVLGAPIFFKLSGRIFLSFHIKCWVHQQYCWAHLASPHQIWAMIWSFFLYFFRKVSTLMPNIYVVFRYTFHPCWTWKLHVPMQKDIGTRKQFGCYFFRCIERDAYTNTLGSSFLCLKNHLLDIFYLSYWPILNVNLYYGLVKSFTFRIGQFER